MSVDLNQIGIDAVDKFISTFNSRCPEDWAKTLNYPHVRPSPFGAIVVAGDAAEYASRVNFDWTISTGWDHSEWDYRRVIHTSPEKIHVAGQWSRYNVEGEIIHTNPIVYVVTRVEGVWGIQSRFGSDQTDKNYDTSGMESRCFKLVAGFMKNFNNRNVSACAELLNYPHYGIGVGEIREHQKASDYALSDNTITIESLQSLQTGKFSMNAGLELNIENDTGNHRFEAVMNITLRDDHLGIQAWSLLNPDAVDG
ncbi:MAG: hypothetical protein VB957_14250 [Pseudomonadales bacterium]